MTTLPVPTVDDHPVVLTGLRLLLAADPRFALVGEVGTPADARTRAAALQPDLIVTDLVLGGADGVAPSARELQVRTMIGSGASLHDVATALGLSVKTIGTCRERLEAELGCDTTRASDRFTALHLARAAPAR